MPNLNRKGVKMEFKHDIIDLTLNVSIKRRNAWMAFVLFVCIFVLLASSLSQDVRNILLQILLWILQTMLFGKPLRDHTLQ